jgi:hypothetical protein
MMTLLLAVAAAAGPVEACTAAVHQSLATARQACQAPSNPYRLWSNAALSPACRAALEAGRDAASEAQGASPATIAGLVHDYDSKVAACHAPPGSAPVTIERQDGQHF